MLIYKRNFHLNCMVCEYSTVYYNNYVAAIDFFSVAAFFVYYCLKNILFLTILILQIYINVFVYIKVNI